MYKSLIKTLGQWGLTVGSLIIGTCIYFLFRQDVLFIEFLFDVKEGAFSQLNTSSPLVYFLVYCLPDGLWYLALLHTNHLIGNQPHSRNDRCTLAINTMVILAPFILEIGQATGHLAGTFDICDLITYLFTLISYSLWSRKKSAKECN